MRSGTHISPGEIVDLQVSNDELRRFFLDEKNRTAIGRAIALARADCKALDLLDRQLVLIETLPADFRGAFPVLSAAMMHMNVLFRLPGKIHESMEIYRDSLVDEEFWGTADSYLKKQPEAQDSALSFELLLIMASSSSLRIAQPAIDATTNLVGILAKTYTNMTDSEMRRQSRAEIRAEHELDDIDYTSAVDDAFACLRLLKRNSLAQEWHSVREASSELKDAFYKMTGDANDDDS